MTATQRDRLRRAIDAIDVVAGDLLAAGAADLARQAATLASEIAARIATTPITDDPETTT